MYGVPIPPKSIEQAAEVLDSRGLWVHMETTTDLETGEPQVALQLRGGSSDRFTDVSHAQMTGYFAKWLEQHFEEGNINTIGVCPCCGHRVHDRQALSRLMEPF